MIYRSQLLSQFTDLIHGSTSKEFGVLKFDRGQDDRVISNRENLAKQAGITLENIVMVKQIHGNHIIKVTNDYSGNGKKSVFELENADGLITNVPLKALVVRTADCVPILIYDPQKRVISAVHAGWQGTIKKIVQETLKAMREEYNVEPSNVFVAMGPSISGQNYDISLVKDDRLLQFENTFGKDSEVIIRTPKGVALDLPLANKKLVMETDVPENQIEVSPICTYNESDTWASYRKDPQTLDTDIWSYICLQS